MNEVELRSKILGISKKIASNMSNAEIASCHICISSPILYEDALKITHALIDLLSRGFGPYMTKLADFYLKEISKAQDSHDGASSGPVEPPA